MRYTTPAFLTAALLIALFVMTGCEQTDPSMHALDLDIGAWSEPFDLTEQDPAAEPLGASVRVRPGPTKLEFELTTDHFEPSAHTPWQGGSGVFVAVIKPGASNYYKEFAFGMSRGEMPIGAIRIADHWQPVIELAPEAGVDPVSGRLRLTFAVPWSICGNLHPLVDTVLNLNVTSVRGAGTLPSGRVSLIADHTTGALRRGIPVRWHWPPQSGPAIYGRPSDLVITSNILELESLALVAADDEPALVSLVLRDLKGAIRHRTTWTLEGRAGRRETRGSLPFDLPAGPAALGATFQDRSSGKTVTWQADLVSLPEQWKRSTADRIAALPQPEKPSLRYRYDALLGEAAVRHRLDHPIALGMTINEIEHLLDLHDRTGSTLPAGGNTIVVMPGRNGAPDLLTSLYLPERWQRGDPVRTLLLMLRATGGQTQAVMQAPHLLAELTAKQERPPPAVLMAIPHLGRQDDHGGDVAMTIEVMDWLRDFLDCGPIHLAAVDLLAAAALEVAMIRRDRLAGVFMITGMNFTPYPDDDPAGLSARVSGLDPSLPAGWIWFPDEQQPGDQAATLRAALRSAGLRLNPARPVQGDLTFDQVWQRALRWAVQHTP